METQPEEAQSKSTKQFWQSLPAYIKVFLVLLVILIIGSSSLLFSVLALNPDSPAGRPNIVVFMTDDQTKETMKVMEKTNALLGGKGVTFEKNITSYNLCCPSRATYFTGQYSHNNGVKDNSGPSGGYQSYHNQDTAMPAVLKNAGYKTIHVGKYLNGTSTNNPLERPFGWTDYRGMSGSATYFNYKLNLNGQLRSYGSAASDYLTDVMRDQAVDAISNTGTDPFYLNLAFFAPHYQGEDSEDNVPAAAPVPAPRHSGMYASVPLPQNPSYLESDVTDKPSHIRNLPRTTTAMPGVTIQQHYRAERESLESVDEAIEAVVNKVESEGKLNNTIFIFTSDNGYFHGEHRIPSKKYFPYEEGVNTPLIISTPSTLSRVDNTHLVSNIDLAPTILDFAGVAPGRRVDGHSLKQVLYGGETGWIRPVLLEGEKNTTKNPKFKGIRTDRYKYIEYANGQKELYDLQNDPYELVSKHNNANYAAVKADLARKLSLLKNCSGRDCDVPTFGFFDVPETNESINAVIWAAKNNIVSEPSYFFSPDNQTTRRVIALWLWRLNGAPSDAPSTNFSDVNPDASDKKAIDWVVSQGIMFGSADNKFNPEGAVNRRSAAVWLWRLNGSPDAPSSTYSDVLATASDKKAIDWVIAQGIATKYADNAFRPNEVMPRKQTILWVWKMMSSPTPN